MTRTAQDSTRFEQQHFPPVFINIRIFRYVDPDAAIVNVCRQEYAQ
jgi:hypothetical protein